MPDDALVLMKISVGKNGTVVSILVVLDVALVHIEFQNEMNRLSKSLNPCCAGRCSSTKSSVSAPCDKESVSILVVLDDALVHINI